MTINGEEIVFDEQPLYVYGIRHNDLIYARIHENDEEPNFTEVGTALITACAENANKRQQYTNTWREMDEVRGLFFHFFEAKCLKSQFRTDFRNEHLI